MADMGGIRWLIVMAALTTLGAGPHRELRVSAIPDEAPAEVAKKLAPLVRYLETALQMKVTFVPSPDYAATVEGLGAKRLDLVWYGGFTFVQARRRTGNVVALIQRAEDSKFHSKFIVPAHSKARTVKDLKGGTFAFGSISSTSGHLMPRYYLMKNGIGPETDFTKVSYSGAHDATARLVESGKVDAGVVSESVLQKLLDEKKLDGSKIRVLWTTPDYVDYNWTARADLDPVLVAKIRAAFLALDPSIPEHKIILDLQRTKKFITTSAENYDLIQEAAVASGLIRAPR